METPRKFIIAELSIRKLGSSSVLIIRLFEFTRPFLYIKCRDCMLTHFFLFSVLSRIKVSFEDVLIRFEHLFCNKKSGVGLELHIKRFLVNS